MKKKILIIEDSETVMAIVKDTLENAGYDVVYSTDGNDAINKARLEKPDLMVMDVMLPNMNGYQICRMLKFDSITENIPVVMLTSRGQEKDKQMGHDVGCNVYLTKPVDLDLLVKTVNDLISKKK